MSCMSTFLGLVTRRCDEYPTPCLHKLIRILDYGRSSKEHEVCACCREIFRGQLKSDNAVTRSIRVDCHRYTPMPSIASPANIRDVGRSQDADSPDTANLPTTLYIDGYKYIHMRTGYEDSKSDIENLWGADGPFARSRTEASKSELQPPWKRYGTHHHTMAMFKLAVHEGCPICNEIWHCVSNISWIDLERVKVYDTGFTTYGIYYFPKTTSFWIIFHVGLSPSHPDLHFDPKKPALHLICRPRACEKSPKLLGRDSLLTLPDFDANFEAVTVNTRTRSSVTSANFRVILQWLEHCNANHDCLAVESDTSQSPPARLLKIGKHLDPEIQLIDTNETKFQRPYATLSYCWGSGVPVRLTSSNLSEFKKGILVFALPKTLRDAVTVARQIGVNYLWIDALCIIQNSSDDWANEARKMADIYSNSYCNISATHTQSCDDGLFTNRDLSKSAVICVDVCWDDVDCRQLGLVDYEFWIKKLEKAPLHSRGWVLQERFLSPRTVHFGDDQVHWECYLGCRCEAFPFGPIPGTASDFPKRRLTSNQPDSETPYRNGYESYKLWGHLVKRFCSSKLTFQYDKLVAISGLARKFQSEMNDEYIAGLWWNQLPAQLVWVGEDVIRSLRYRAPSWSWASLEGEISISKLDTDTLGLIDPIEHNIEYKTEDKHGQVKSGSIRVSGKLFPHVLVPFGPNGWEPIFYDEDLNRVPNGRPAFMDISTDYSDFEYYCLPVLLEKSTPAVVTCMILKQTDNAQGEYSRIGLFSTQYKEDIDILAHESKPYEMDSDLYDPTSTIIII